MHFLEAWTDLPLIDLVLLLGPVVALLLVCSVPGRWPVRIGALIVTLSVPWRREVASSPIEAAGWALLWLALAWLAPGEERAEAGGITRGQEIQRQGRAESWAVGVLLATALLGSLVAAVASADLGVEPTRRASYGVLLLCSGVLLLMLRRHAGRAALGFAAMGLGLRALDGTARAVETAPDPSTLSVRPFAALLGASLTVAIVLTLARGRERSVGSAWVSDAHELRD